MTQSRMIRWSVSVAAFACILALAHLETLAAYDDTDLVTPSTTAIAPSTSESESELAPAPQGNPAGAILVDNGQLIPTYQCSPAQECVYRACLVGPSGKYWFRGDYLLWWTRGPRVAPLVSTGVIGEPGTEILFGNERVNGDSRSDFRINFGWWFHCGRTVGVEFDYFTLGDTGTDFRFQSSGESGSPYYARPFYDVNPAVMGENAEDVSHPTWLAGTVDGRIEESFESAGANLRLNLLCNMPCCSCGCGESCDEGCQPSGCGDSCGPQAGCAGAARCRGLSSLCDRLHRACYRVDFIAGYRHYALDDSLRVNESLYYREGHGFYPAGATFDILDSFRSHNDFHGGELGLVTQFYRNRWSLELLAKMALGNNCRVVNISGQTVFDSHQPGDEPAVFDAGILAGDTNSGRYTSNEFVVIPQFGAELGYQLTCRLRAFVGYNFIYWANVARASEQVDYTLNSTYFPNGGPVEGEPRPEFVWNDSDFWAQGMNLGMEYRF